MLPSPRRRGVRRHVELRPRLPRRLQHGSATQWSPLPRKWFDRCHNPPASRHPGGVNCLLADGSVRFISDTIDTGNLMVQQPDDGASMYGVWGALGSKAGGETIGEF